MLGFTWDRADTRTGTWLQGKSAAQTAFRPEIRVGERRSGGERRNASAPARKPAKSNAHFAIRSCDDRRILRYGLSVRTGLSVARIGDWCEGNLRGGSCIVLSEPERPNSMKMVKLMFELDIDREDFKKFIRMDA